ncbi:MULTISPECIES: adenylate/guanylate cyclase domain-containing protein [unclassified Rhizobium]|uniref:adenylate/guanylate cyclase domain-containing protein n=1 Tax=unclassified Rhizobium TaxID=2613769 RepID=UPI001048A7A9|nr:MULTISPECIES: adenylate/guanylate cyclase domain-containing protein [unclassified Rhizobium]MBB3394898.1 TolB-like protein/class 3 adenylate cyclase/Tfp pilus assembly protein PilF [Rhizobium sp. BK060]TCM78496.1 TolB-like protein [Rhizobium sp. BK068]
MSEARKIAAILVSDVVGYSRLAGADEDRILARLRALRSDLIDPTIAVYHGRVVKRTGDGSLVEFRSVVDAVRCAIEVQNSMIERNAGLPAERRIEFRVGIHLGDVVEESDGDLMGDGVNIAARLQGICDPGGICLSEQAYWQVKARLDLAINDRGDVQLKNINEPVHVYSLLVGIPTQAKPATPADSAGPEKSSTRLALPDKPSIAVLPFQNMSGDPEQEYFADGMVEDIITGLSRIKWLFVIARNSSFVYKGKAVDVRQVGRELGVRYVLEGGVRNAGNRLRITAQLVEAETGAHLWADRYDGAREDVFDLQDQITEKVVGIVEPSLQRSEIERARQKRPENLDAYDLYLRAVPHMATVMPADAKVAAGLLEDALGLDPNYAAAHARLAWCHEIFFTRGGFDEADKVAGIGHARSVIASGTDDAAALAIAAFAIFMLGKDQEAALNAAERALSLNSSCATALYFGSVLYAFAGLPAKATFNAERALRLSPFDPMAYAAHLALGTAAIQQERYDEAVAHCARAAQANPRFSTLYFFQAAALALAGRQEEARPAVQRLLELEPGFRLRVFFELGMVRAIADRFADGARMLGLPE